MKQRDIMLSVWAGFIIGLFLIPTAKSTGAISLIPFSIYLLPVIFPFLTAIGILFAHLVSAKLSILWQIAKFALVGVVNTSIDFGLLNFLIIVSGITSGYQIIFLNTISFAVAVVNSFFWNKEWVFGSKKKNRFVTFLVVTLIGLAINSGIVYTMTTYVSPVGIITSEQWANIAKALATGISMIWNFMGYRLVVFKK